MLPKFTLTLLGPTLGTSSLRSFRRSCSSSNNAPEKTDPVASTDISPSEWTTLPPLVDGQIVPDQLVSWSESAVQKMPEIKDVDLSRMVWRLAKHGASRSHLGEELWRSFWRSWFLQTGSCLARGHFGPIGLSQLVWSLSLLELNPDIWDPAFWPLWFYNSRPKFQQSGWTTQSLNNCLLAIARFHKAPSLRWLEAYFQLIGQRLRLCDEQELANISWSLAKLQKSGKLDLRHIPAELPDMWSSAVRRKIGTLEARHLSIIVYAVSILKWPLGADFWNAWMRAYSYRIKEFSDHGLSLTVYSLSQLSRTYKLTDQFDPVVWNRFWSSLIWQVVERLPEFSATTLATLLHGFSRLPQVPYRPSFRHRCIRQALQVMPTATSAQLANFVTSLARRPSLLPSALAKSFENAWTDRCVELLEDSSFGSRELTTSLLGASHLKFSLEGDQFWTAWYARCDALLQGPEFSAYSLAAMLQAFAKLGRQPREETFGLWNEKAWKIMKKSFTKQDIQDVLSACSLLELYPTTPFWDSLWPRLRVLLKSFSPAAIVRLCRHFVNLRLKPPSSFLDTIVVALDRLDLSPEQAIGLANCLAHFKHPIPDALWSDMEEYVEQIQSSFDAAINLDQSNTNSESRDALVLPMLKRSLLCLETIILSSANHSLSRQRLAGLHTRLANLIGSLLTLLAENDVINVSLPDAQLMLAYHQWSRDSPAPEAVSIFPTGRIQSRLSTQCLQETDLMSGFSAAEGGSLRERLASLIDSIYVRRPPVFTCNVPVAELGLHLELVRTRRTRRNQTWISVSQEAHCLYDEHGQLTDEPTAAVELLIDQLQRLGYETIVWKRMRKDAGDGTPVRSRRRVKDDLTPSV